MSNDCIVMDYDLIQRIYTELTSMEMTNRHFTIVTKDTEADLF